MRAGEDHGFVYRGREVVAAQDWGGDGPDVVLTHGASSNLMSMRPLRRHLEPCRVVAVDLPHHGHSSAGQPFTWDLCVDALDAVVDGLRLDNPAVVGHSLGGMVAGAYGARHDECRGVVNLDGHGDGGPEQYPGEDPAEVEAFLEALRTTPVSIDPLDHQGAATAGDAAWREQRLTALVEQFGGTIESMGRFFEREFPQIREGWFERRPLPDFVGNLRAELRSRPLQDLWRRVACPFLFFFCTATDPNEPELIPGQHAMNAARNRWLADDLAALAAERVNVAVEHIDTTHMGILGRSAEVAARILEFLGVESGPTTD